MYICLFIYSFIYSSIYLYSYMGNFSRFMWPPKIYVHWTVFGGSFDVIAQTHIIFGQSFGTKQNINTKSLQSQRLTHLLVCLTFWYTKATFVDASNEQGSNFCVEGAPLNRDHSDSNIWALKKIPAWLDSYKKHIYIYILHNIICNIYYKSLALS